jgi:RNA polymerase sigma-70 factor (ECF subfamily)
LPEKYDVSDIYARQVDVVYRVCLSYVKSKADAEDCTSDTFVKLIKTRPHLTDAQHERAWLIRVAANVCKDHLKRSSRTDANIDDYHDVRAPSSDESSDLLDAVRALPEDCRGVVYMHYYEGYSFEEIAKILHVSESTVRRHAAHARELLREHLQDYSQEGQVSKL